jgi:hypothetical protein
MSSRSNNFENFMNYNSNSNNNNAQRRAGANFARNSGLLDTRQNLRWLARHMYRHARNSAWFHGGLNVITNRFMKLNKVRNKWRGGVRKIRAAKKHKTIMMRQTGRRG